MTDINSNPIIKSSENTPTALTDNGASGSRVADLEADVLLSTGQDGKVSVYLIVWIAFYRSVQAGQDRASLTKQEMNQVRNVQNQLIDRLSNLNYKVVSEDEAWNTELVTSISTNNQSIQANVTILQDKIGQTQQISQIAMSQASADMDTVGQTMTENFAVSQLVMDITKLIER